MSQTRTQMFGDGWIRKDQPDQGAVHVNRPLTNLSLQYANDDTEYVADRVFPLFPVDKQSDLLWKYSKGAFFKNDMKPRAAGAESAGGGYDVNATDSYRCTVWGWHNDISDQRRGNEDTPLNSDKTATTLCTQKALLNREVNFASNFMTTGKWAQDWTGNTSASNYGSNTILQWNDPNSTPLEDVAAIRLFQKQRTGRWPNKLTIGSPVWEVLKNHPEIKDRVKFGSDTKDPAIITKQLVAQVMELDEIIVAEAIQDTSNEPATFTGAFIIGKVGLLHYTPPGQTYIDMPIAGLQFVWRGYAGANSYGMRIKKFRMEWLASDRVEVEQAYDQHIIGNDLAQFMNTLVA